MALTSLLFVNILQKVGILNRLGTWIIVKTGGTFSRFIWALFFASAIICFVSFNTAWLLCFALAFALYKSLECHVGDRESVVIVWTTAIGAILAGVYVYCPLLITFLSNGVASVIPGWRIEWYEVMFYNMPIFFVSIVLVWLGLKWYARGKDAKFGEKSNASAEASLQYFKAELEKLGPITTDEKKGLALLVLIAVFLFTQFMHGLPAWFAFAVASALAYFPGINIGDDDNLKNLGWEGVFVIAMFLSMGTIATNLGITNIITQTVTPLVAALGPYWSVFGTSVFGALANFVLSPFAMAAILPSQIASYCVAAGFDPTAHVMAMYLSKDILFFPYEYPMYLILYGFGMVKMGQMIKICSIKSVLLLLVIAFIMLPYWTLVGIM